MKKFLAVLALLTVGSVYIFADTIQIFRYAMDNGNTTIDISDYGNYIFISTSSGQSGRLDKITSYDGSLLYTDNVGDYMGFTNNAQTMIFDDYNTKQYITFHYVTSYYLNY